MGNTLETTIEAWAKNDASIARALDIATRAYQGQFDNAGVAYIRHSMAVAVSLGKGDSKDVVVALLHDGLEDTAVAEQLSAP